MNIAWRVIHIPGCMDIHKYICISIDIMMRCRCVYDASYDDASDNDASDNDASATRQQRVSADASTVSVCSADQFAKL